MGIWIAGYYQLQQVILYQITWEDDHTWRNLKDRGESVYGSFWRTILALIWTEWWKPLKTEDSLCQKSQKCYLELACLVTNYNLLFLGQTYISNMPSHGWVTIHRIWIGNWIYWTLLQVLITISLIHSLSLLSLLCLHQSLPGNGFQQQTFPLLCVPELSLCLSYQLLTATAHRDWTAAVV
jgi:hypothetical protein